MFEDMTYETLLARALSRVTSCLLYTSDAADE